MIGEHDTESFALRARIYSVLHLTTTHMLHAGLLRAHSYGAYMTNPSAKAKSYVKVVRAMSWPGLQRLWADIRDGKTNGWDRGKALEYWSAVRPLRLVVYV